MPVIDFENEDILTFPQAAKYAGPGRNGKATHVATIHRWAVNGCRGTCLEWLQRGGQKVTSKQAVNRFFERLTLKANPRGAQSVRTPRQRERAIAAAERELEAAGI